MHKSCYTLYSVRRVSCNTALRSHLPFHSNTISKPPVSFFHKAFKIWKKVSTTSVYARTRAHAHEHYSDSAHNCLSAVPLMVTLLSEKNGENGNKASSLTNHFTLDSLNHPFAQLESLPQVRFYGIRFSCTHHGIDQTSTIYNALFPSFSPIDLDSALALVTRGLNENETRFIHRALRTIGRFRRQLEDNALAKAIQKELGGMNNETDETTSLKWSCLLPLHPPVMVCCCSGCPRSFRVCFRLCPTTFPLTASVLSH